MVGDSVGILGGQLLGLARKGSGLVDSSTSQALFVVENVQYRGFVQLEAFIMLESCLKVWVMRIRRSGLDTFRSSLEVSEKGSDMFRNRLMCCFAACPSTDCSYE